MLFAGLKDEDMGKPQVGISSMWYEGNPCNMHLLSLADEVKKGVVSDTSDTRVTRVTPWLTKYLVSVMLGFGLGIFKGCCNRKLLQG
jgi:hypothetical protein